jgi:hypothetical protein
LRKQIKEDNVIRVFSLFSVSSHLPGLANCCGPSSEISWSSSETIKVLKTGTLHSSFLRFLREARHELSILLPLVLPKFVLCFSRRKTSLRHQAPNCSPIISSPIHRPPSRGKRTATGSETCVHHFFLHKGMNL